jgi:hypothetical protein
MARQGKIARLPYALKQQVNQRLLDSESHAKILGWLNAEPEAIKIWDAYFDGAPATPQNLSEWANGGFEDWKNERAEVENTKALAAYAAELAGAGGSISTGLQAILGGRILESFEVLLNADGGDETPDNPVDRIAKLGSVITSMRNADTAADRVSLDKQKVAAKKEDQRLAREKFERQTVEKFMAFARSPEAQTILNSNSKKDVKMQELRQLMFG